MGFSIAPFRTARFKAPAWAWQPTPHAAPAHPLLWIDCTRGVMDLKPIPQSGASQPPAEPDETSMAPPCAVFRRFLRSKNLKYTPERADILNAIIEGDDVFEAEELLLNMRQRGHRVSKATIYRTIKLLQDAGIITQALFDARQSHYRLIFGRAPETTWCA